jgi:outer membrane scaffolding protein for murein synthesis (MipA/OmpV family)
MLRSKLVVLCLSVHALSCAWAQEAAPVTTLLGAGLWSRPAYDGASNSQATAPIPVVRHYGRTWFARTTYGVLEGGARAEVASGLTVGAQLAYEGGRSQAESSFLSANKVADLPFSVSWGAHIEYEKNIGPMPLIALLRYRQDTDGQRGAQTDLRLTAGVFSGGGFNAGVFAQATWADAKATQYYYGLSPAQAAVTGLPVYEAQGGQLFNAAGLLWSYDLTPKWMLLGSFEARRLRGDALASPLVQVSGNGYASLSLAYQF